MLVTTGNEITGHTITGYLGIARGIVVRAPTFSQGFAAGFQRLAGGNIEAYAEVCETARLQAYNRLVQHALQLGANAVIGMRYDATEFAEGVTEVLAYGTAVKLDNPPPADGIDYAAAVNLGNPPQTDGIEIITR